MRETAGKTRLASIVLYVVRASSALVPFKHSNRRNRIKVRAGFDLLPLEAALLYTTLNHRSGARCMIEWALAAPRPHHLIPLLSCLSHCFYARRNRFENAKRRPVLPAPPRFILTRRPFRVNHTGLDLAAASGRSAHVCRGSAASGAPLPFRLLPRSAHTVTERVFAVFFFLFSPSLS